MYSIYEKIVELCPIIKELLADDGAFGGKGPSPEEFKKQNQAINDTLSTVANLQSFIMGSHGNN